MAGSEIPSTREAPAAPQGQMAQRWPVCQDQLLLVLPLASITYLSHLIHDCILIIPSGIYRPWEQVSN